MSKLGNIGKMFQQFTSIIPLIPHNKFKLLTTFSLSICNWMTNISMTYFFYLALGAHVPLIVIVTYLPIAIFVGLIPLTIAGMGTRDAAIIKLFQPYARSVQSFGVSILYTVFGYWFGIIFGLLFMYFRPRKLTS